MKCLCCRYATPRLFDVNADGVKDVVAQTFVRHLEVFDGAEGHPLPGFPFTLPASTSHSTPLIHDIQGTGVPHIGVVTYDAELLWLTPTGIPLVGYSIRVPPLRVLKKWHDGLQDPSPDSELYSTGTVSTRPIASDTDFGRPHEPSVQQPHAPARRLMGVKPSRTGGSVSRRLLYSNNAASAASDAAASDAAASDAAASDAAADSPAAAADAASSVAPSHESAPVESTTHEESPPAHEEPAASPSPSPDVLHVADDAAAAAPSDGDAAVGVNDDQAPDQPGDAQAYDAAPPPPLPPTLMQLQIPC